MWYRGLIQTERAERVGGARIDVIETDFGSLDFLLDHLVKGGELYLLNTNYIDSVTLGDRTFKEMEATLPGKDHTARRILGEYGSLPAELSLIQGKAEIAHPEEAEAA